MVYNFKDNLTLTFTPYTGELVMGLAVGYFPKFKAMYINTLIFSFMAEWGVYEDHE